MALEHQRQISLEHAYAHLSKILPQLFGEREDWGMQDYELIERFMQESDFFRNAGECHGVMSQIYLHGFISHFIRHRV